MSPIYSSASGNSICENGKFLVTPEPLDTCERCGTFSGQSHQSRQGNHLISTMPSPLGVHLTSSITTSPYHLPQISDHPTEPLLPSRTLRYKYSFRFLAHIWLDFAARRAHPISSSCSEGNGWSRGRNLDNWCIQQSWDKAKDKLPMW